MSPFSLHYSYTNISPITWDAAHHRLLLKNVFTRSDSPRPIPFRFSRFPKQSSGASRQQRQLITISVLLTEACNFKQSSSVRTSTRTVRVAQHYLRPMHNPLLALHDPMGQHSWPCRSPLLIRRVFCSPGHTETAGANREAQDRAALGEGQAGGDAGRSGRPGGQPRQAHRVQDRRRSGEAAPEGDQAFAVPVRTARPRNRQK